MVYIFGGGFVNGNGNFLGNGPHYLLEDGVVVVCITYRVGPFGTHIDYINTNNIHFVNYMDL